MIPYTCHVNTIFIHAESYCDDFNLHCRQKESKYLHSGRKLKRQTTYMVIMEAAFLKTAMAITTLLMSNLSYGLSNMTQSIHLRPAKANKEDQRVSTDPLTH